MKNRVKNIAKILSFFMVIVLTTIVFSACSLTKDKDETYAISGYVYDDYGIPVQDVTITSEIATVKTDKDGKFTIAGIESSVIISASKTGYQFKDVSKAITSSKDDANFVAYKEYKINGLATNNGVALVGANVTAKSLSGTFYTTTDETGSFVFDGVAGESVISCEVDQLQFYEIKTTIDNPNVTIETTSSLTVNFLVDEDIDLSQIKLYIDGKNKQLTGLKNVFEGIKCGSEVEIKTDYYKLNKPSIFIVDSIDQVENFVLSKIFAITGTVKSGDITLSGAKIYVDDELLATSDNNGYFSIGGLFGTHNLSVLYSGFNFDSQMVDKTTENVTFIGGKNIVVDAVIDYKNIGSIDFDVEYEAFENGKFLINDVVLGQKVSISSEKYFVDTQEIVVTNENHYSLRAYAKYNATISFEGDFEVQYILDGAEVQASGLVGLYGTHTVSAKYLNYKFSEATVSYENRQANLTYTKPYNVKIYVNSGSKQIEDFSVIFNEKTYSSENGFVELENLINENNVTISANGYNNKTIVISNSDDKHVELTYSVRGVVRTGDVLVASAEVSVGENKAMTNENGEFVLNGLTGDAQVVVQKEGFEYEPQYADCYKELDFNGSYEISGVINTFANAKIEIYDNNFENRKEYVSDENGRYIISGLVGEFIIKPVDTSLGLMPTQYLVRGAGANYSFSTSGFSASGVVKTGSVPISRAKVVAGSFVTYTGSDGKFSFDLLTSECEIYVEKEGYVFSAPILVSEDKEDLVFTATYKIVGTVYVGENGVAGVEVSAGDILVTTNENGEFELSGLVGNVEISFAKENYIFENLKNITEYQTVQVFGKASATIVVVSGNLTLDDYVARQNGNEVPVVNGKVLVVANIGDVITFEKQGYVIESITITEPKQYTANATYMVSGKVVSGEELIAGVYVFLNNEQVAITDELGKFAVSGISGSASFRFEKQGFSFKEEKEVSGYEENVEISAYYRVIVSAKVGAKILTGVSVTIGDETKVTSDEKLVFEVSGRFSIVASKEGYSFDEITNKFGEQTFVLVAYYSVSGKILSGTIVIAGADISVGGKTTKTDANGEFVVSGIQGETNLIVSKDGYVSQSINGISDKATIEIKDLKYSFSISFDKTGVTVTVNGKAQLVTGSSINLTGLVGKNIVKFSKANTSFSVNNLEIKEPGSISITTSVSYTASGYVKTSEGLAVAGIKISSQSGDYSVTDTNGYYKFDNVAGEISIDDENITKDRKTVNADGEYNFTISNFEFGYYLYANAYKNLDNAASFQIIGNGTVNPSMGGSQSVYSLVKKDNSGRKLKQNLNYGNTVAGVDPKVSLIAYFDGKTWYYDQIKNVNSNLTASHSVGSLKAISVSDYQSIYGASPDAYMPYNFNKTSGIKSISSVKASGNNYTFTIELNTSSSVYSLYAKQMKALSNQDVKEFNYIYLNFTMTKTGWITSLNIDEKYTVELMSVKITSNITYKFTTQKPNMKINDIDVSSDSALQVSLKESSQTEIETVSAFAKNSGDLVSKEIYGY